jgi:cell division septal protein FtsQ
VETGKKRYGVGLGRVKRDWERVPAIRSASVERVVPDTQRIRIAEREAVARLVYPVIHQPGTARSILVDAHGFAMLPLEPHEVAEGATRHYQQLPVLIGIPPNRVRPGWPIVSERVSSALELMRSFEASPMAGLMKVASIDVSLPGVLRVRTQDGCEVHFGLRDYERQLGRWWAVVQHARRAGRELAWLDLSVSNNVPVRWREEQVNNRGKENV